MRDPGTELMEPIGACVCPLACGMSATQARAQHVTSDKPTDLFIARTNLPSLP